MGLFTAIIGLPLAPLRGTVWVAEQVLTQAQQQFSDPALIRRQLEEIDRLRRDGELTDDEAEGLEDELVQRLLPPHPRAAEWEV